MKNEMAFDDIFITHEWCPSLTFHGKDRDMVTMKFSLKLFSTVKSNTLLVVVKITLKIIMNQNNERRKHTNKKTLIPNR